jgi:hypothetical protein
MMRCASVPKGQLSTPISREDVEQCYHHGDAELETVQASTSPSSKRSRTQ